MIKNGKWQTMGNYKHWEMINNENNKQLEMTNNGHWQIM